ncbi:methylation-associated defense system restriction endonuclease subunit S MAD5 [Streptomyces caniscabiei]|uniref:Restriction endonuclease subunit S n=1 Tax=Streptomyces caniscabiei TaxID=2746961 RepID=A0ABU4MH91_9ACTN|nr:restriction endonuclease subunit S [Streptomyces caniscabiei]MBE4737234.1 restriction endonuclease subunit S [Streptomyces caniscabiei]MBE4757530.1 restriction endonuclease subunit S [Streptomyces caniscabiei]MBE4786649.1 restriction endonuclease subunit S [Streptomyces caniscabiei]MBE4795097.1 restriction endonuclease subunit S [Streptomyces caniscabiei]MDX2942889.1 restriction endonuclease subunit S [Streptomyces caniscabiei]
MKIAERGNPAMRSWLDRQGLRLDAKPYLSGAFATRRLLERLTVEKMPLSEVTAGHAGGIYNGPQFRRVYLTDPEHSVPFVGSKDMLVADLSSLPRLRKTDAESSSLHYLRLEPGMTLISCSGFNAGRRSYVRPDMAGYWSSQDVLKVVPDPGKIGAGYLYAFLASRFGEALVKGTVYGSAVKHIEPHHIEGIPVPRFDVAVEKEIHELMESAAALRAASQQGLSDATRDLFETAGLGDLLDLRWHEQGRDLGFAPTGLKANTLRALNFQPRARKILRRLGEVENVTLGEVCQGGQLSRGLRFPRVDGEPGDTYSYRLVGQRQAFWLRPEGRWISKAHTSKEVVAEDETVLVAARGTLGENEVFGRSILVTGVWSGHAYSEDFLRMRSGLSGFSGAYLSALLRAEPLFRVLRSCSTGGKQQDIHLGLCAAIPVPTLTAKDRERIAKTVRQAYRRRDEADRNEDLALAALEKAVAQNAGVSTG